MKVKKCPVRKTCCDYRDNNCDNCDFGNEFTKLHKRIDHLKKQNETLTIQRNAWALTARALGDRWISVDDRLPEEDGTYITYTNAKGKDKGVIVQSLRTRNIRGNTIRRWEWQTRISPWIVTHWMPLPEPPKMKGGAE